jgi:VRR-NUC domain
MIARVDENQPSIVDCLRRCGCLVEVLSRVGRGVPDLLVLTPRGQFILLEVKDPTQPKHNQQLTPDQETWHRLWRRGPVFVVRTEAEAVAATGHDCTSFDIDRSGRRTCSACHRELCA